MLHSERDAFGHCERRFDQRRISVPIRQYKHDGRDFGTEGPISSDVILMAQTHAHAVTLVNILTATTRESRAAGATEETRVMKLAIEPSFKNSSEDILESV